VSSGRGPKTAPYLTLAKYVKSEIWMGRPSVQCDIYQKLWYCSFGKMENSGTNVDFAFLKSYGKPLRQIF
jgi:hypothetical protein